ncbi:lipoprotein insertase outer membrane protein LolB [Acidiferrobacter sp.]|jgi:outer membrane lipoprotein LolB|uniref:lipoprotein insertase outer membrane protein LolB n=1 Tax=Acidiferrobacter sp. TaxID=1872107 RepID=UPI00263220BB|nr:lipoprotein insertase outer membrane protein LolB [Acidiferrobacter sp.]
MRRFIAGLLVVLLAGCATIPPTAVRYPQRVWRTHRARMMAIRRFRVSAQSGVHAGHHGGTLALHWRVAPTAYQMTGYGPFGRLIFRLRADAEGARLWTGRGHFAGASASRLLWRLTGWRLPVAGLRFWIRGIPAPGPVTGRTLDRTGLLASLRQDGWTIRYRRYRPTPSGRLPRLLTLTHAVTTGGSPVVVTIRIDRWDVI